MAEVANNIIKKLRESGIPVYSILPGFKLDKEELKMMYDKKEIVSDVDDTSNIDVHLSENAVITDSVFVNHKYDLENLWVEIGEDKKGVMQIDPFKKLFKEDPFTYGPIPKKYLSMAVKILIDDGFKESKDKLF